MAATSFAETIAQANLISAGLRSNLDKVAKRGLDEAFIVKMEDDSKRLHSLNAEQEALKTRLKEKTAEINLALDLVKQQISESKKVVKLAIDRSGWKEFGIS